MLKLSLTDLWLYQARRKAIEAEVVAAKAVREERERAAERAHAEFTAIAAAAEAARTRAKDEAVRTYAESEGSQQCPVRDSKAFAGRVSQVGRLCERCHR